MSKLPERIMFGLIGLIVVAWVGYHIFDQYYQPLETETVFDYTKSQTLTARGIAIRAETVIDQTASGIENYLFEDAERVTVGQNVAEFYESAGSDRNVKRMREIEGEIEMLRSAQDKSINNLTNTDNLNRDIRDQLGQLSQLSSVGSYATSQQLRSSLTSLLNRRQVATGKVEDFSGRIAELSAEHERLERSTSGSAMVSATAPVSGYFVKRVDGYERYLTPKVVEEYGIEDFARLIRSELREQNTSFAGKIVTSQNWYFAVTMKKHHAENLVEGRTVQLQFPSALRAVPVTIHTILEEKDNDDAVIIFHCDQVNSELVGIRMEDVTIQFVEYTGLRISTSSLHFEGGKQGVFVVEENIVRFKEVQPIYDEAGFILVERNVVDTPGYVKTAVRLYDQVITKGTDLYDGKTLS